MGDSFDPPSGIFNLNASGQRVWIADYSGLPIETIEWSGQRYLKSWISGQPVQSTVSIDLSGFSIASNVSGNVVYLTSGQNNVQMSGQTVYLASGFNEIAGSFTANISGQPVSISGQTVVASVTTNISGQVVYLVSGQNNVQISGQTVQIAGGVSTSVSGNVVVVPSTSVSGNAVRISGETIQIAGGINVSGSPVRVSGETVYLVSGQNNVQISGQLVNVIGTVGTSVSGNVIVVPFTSVSGNQTAISGQVVYLVSGQNSVQISGQTVTVAGTVGTSISGNMVSISGQPVLTSVSGNMVSTSGQPSPISGQIVYLTSGQNTISNYGFIDASGQLTQLRVTQSGQLISGIPHKLVVTFSGESIIGSVSGNMVSVSGQPARISGQTVIAEISGQTIVVPSTSVSGNMISISGQPVSISGNVVVASVTTNISGQTVYLASGNNPVQLYAFDPSGVALRPLIVNQSGGNVLRVDAGAINVASNVSGNVVYLTSGQNAVQISGQLVAVSGLVATSVSGNMVSISGQAVSISGNVVVASVTTNISGQTVYLASGNNNAQISGQAIMITDNTNNFVAVVDAADDSLGNNENALNTLGRMYGRSVVGTSWRPAFITQSGNIVSGVPNRLVVALSGDPVTVSGSVVQISGQLVAVSGTVAASVSGNMVSISGQPVSISGNVVVASVTTNISGQTVYLASGQNNVQTSGQSVYLASGNNIVQIGDGQDGSASLALVVGVGDNQGTGDASLSTFDHLYGYNKELNTWPSLNVTASGHAISGLVHKLIVGFSGDPVTISGNAVLISGQLVAVSGTVAASVSGNMVSISGQPVSVSGNVVVASVTTNISGQTVYTASGKNDVQISGETIIISDGSNIPTVTTATPGITPLGQFLQTVAVGFGYDTGQSSLERFMVTSSGKSISGIHNKLVVTFSGDSIIGSVSGNAVSISGQLVAVSGTVAASVSGNMVSISGQAVSVSGNVVVASVTTNISGQTVYLASGNNDVQISGQVVEPISGGLSRLHALDLSGNQWLPLATTASGKNRLAISIYDVANTNSVTVGSAADGESNSAALKTRALLEGYDTVNDQFVRARVTASGQGMSGIQHKLAVTFSGDSIIGSVSGNMVSVSGQPALISGQLVAVSGTVATSVSGNMVSVSGQPVTSSGNMVSISGQPVTVSGDIIQPQIPVQIRTRDTLLITGASGGIALLSGDVLRVTVRNIGISGTVMYVGGSGDYPWVASGQSYPAFSGRGLWLRDGDGVTVHTSNMAFVRVVSHTSGQYVSYLGEQY